MPLAPISGWPPRFSEMVPENFGIAFSNLAYFLSSCSLVAIPLGITKGMIENKKERIKEHERNIMACRCAAAVWSAIKIM